MTIESNHGEHPETYGYVAAVYRVVRKWKGEQRAWKSAGLASRLQRDTSSMRVEPYAVVICCTSDPDKIDDKTRIQLVSARRGDIEQGN